MVPGGSMNVTERLSNTATPLTVPANRTNEISWLRGAWTQIVCGASDWDVVLPRETIPSPPANASMKPVAPGPTASTSMHTVDTGAPKSASMTPSLFSLKAADPLEHTLTAFPVNVLPFEFANTDDPWAQLSPSPERRVNVTPWLPY